MTRQKSENRFSEGRKCGLCEAPIPNINKWEDDQDTICHSCYEKHKVIEPSIDYEQYDE